MAGRERADAPVTSANVELMVREEKPGWDADYWPPECVDSKCKKCQKCFAIYVQLKWEGVLD